jgi:PmbA protein
MPGLVGRDGFEAIADAALELSGVDGVEVLLLHQWGGLTRFASSEIHQSTSNEDTELRVRVVVGGRIGVASTNEFSAEGARRAARSAKEMAEVVAPDPLFPGLAPKAPVEDRRGFDDTTASADPRQRAEGVATLVAQAADGFVAAGAFETTAVELGLANTEGQRCWTPSSLASISTVMTGGDGGSGFAESFTSKLGEVDAEAVGRRASDKARRSQNPKPIDPGTFEVVLEPSATATLVGFLAFMGFGGRLIAEGRSCFSGKEGQLVAAPSVSIYDDARSPQTVGFPFDFEGVPRQRVDLISDGVFQDGVYDLRTAKQTGKRSTGHALPPPDPDGPTPLNLFMATGDASLDDMISATQHGLLISRFHYSNVVHPVESTITGMTRDGTFLIEGGEITHPVQNLRMTQSIIEALLAASMIGDRTELASEFFFSASRVPALKVDRFQFTGRSDH